MDELFEQATRAGSHRSAAEKTIAIILGFLRVEGPSDKVQALIDKIPGAEAATAANGGLSRLMGDGLIAGDAKPMDLGLGMVDIQNIAHELSRFGRDKIGADQKSEFIAGTPGFSQFAYTLFS